jgi:hypothetical protein
VDLNVDPSLQIDIPDALSERDKVKFTVHTKVSDRMALVLPPRARLQPCYSQWV